MKLRISSFKSFLCSRAFKKALTWRVIALVILLIVTYAVTGSLVIAGSVGLVDAVIKTFLYWLHEKAWEKLD